MPCLLIKIFDIIHFLCYFYADPNEEWFGKDDEKQVASERYTKNYKRVNTILCETSYQPPSMKRVESLRNTVVLLEKQIVSDVS